MLRCLAAAALGMLALPNALAHEASPVPDSFLVFESFPDVVGIFDSDNDTIFECLTAKRTSFDKEDKKVQYVWHLNDHNDSPQNMLTFDAEAGPSPDTYLYIEESGAARPQVGKVYYTDYENCAITDMFYQGRQCILWAQVGKEDSLPEKCLKKIHAALWSRDTDI
uniref:Lipocalin/cytosolic fatty-acid binding domain-containing protein n=1 Tax=Amblyomma maculatum TaxID=34609 RepID=G3MRU9_AMBMU